MCRRMLVLLHGLLHMRQETQTRAEGTEQRLYDYKMCACVGKCQDGSVCCWCCSDRIMASSVIVCSIHVTQQGRGKKGNGQSCREACCFLCFIVEMRLCGMALCSFCMCRLLLLPQPSHIVLSLIRVCSAI